MDRNVLITGASLGIGKTLALRLASMGYNLLITYYINKEKSDLLVEEIKNKYQVKCFNIRCDLKKEEDIKKTIDYFKEVIGGLDILVNNACHYADNLFLDKSKNEFMDVLEVNVVGTFLMSKYAIQIMNENGIIINMASTDGIDTYSIYSTDYAVSKAGIIQLTKSMSLIFKGLKTIAIAPNWVETESTKEMNREYLEEELKRVGQTKLINCDHVVDVIINRINDEKIKSGEVIRIDD